MYLKVEVIPYVLMNLSVQANGTPFAMYSGLHNVHTNSNQETFQGNYYRKTTTK